MSERRCIRCNCILRRSNPDSWCSPCADMVETTLPDPMKLLLARSRMPDIVAGQRGGSREGAGRKKVSA